MPPTSEPKFNTGSYACSVGWSHRCLSSLSWQPISRAATRRRPGIDLQINTDASGGGWGGVIIDPTPGPAPVSPPPQTVSGSFPLHVLHTPSNFRELLALLFVLQAASAAVCNNRTDLYMDNLGAAISLGATLPTAPHKIRGGSNAPSMTPM